MYIFVDAVFPKDVRSSAQGLFNLLILGVGNVVASFLFPTLIGRLSVDGAVDYTRLFLVPTGMALAAVLLLALFFRPPSRGPVAESQRGGPHRHGQPGPALSFSKGQASCAQSLAESPTPSPAFLAARLRSPARRPFGAAYAGGAGAGETPFFQRHKQPVGIQLYSLGPDLAKELDAQLATVAKIGFKSVELARPSGPHPGRTEGRLRQGGPDLPQRSPLAQGPQRFQRRPWPSWRTNCT